MKRHWNGGCADAAPTPRRILRGASNEARRELEYFDRYDYLVINREGSVQSSADTIMRIVESEQCSVRRNTDFAKHYFS